MSLRPKSFVILDQQIRHHERAVSSLRPGIGEARSATTNTSSRGDNPRHAELRNGKNNGKRENVKPEGFPYLSEDVGSAGGLEPSTFAFELRRALSSDGGPSTLRRRRGGRSLRLTRGFPARMAQKVVKRWADYARIGDLSPRDLRRTAITRALDSGLPYRQVRMMSKHRDPKTVMRHDHGRENMEQNAVNFLRYEEE